MRRGDDTMIMGREVTAMRAKVLLGFVAALGLSASVELGCDDAEAPACGASGVCIAASGAVGDQCAPDDGPALGFVIGAASTCTGGTGTQPQVHFNAYPGSTDGLAAGQAWSFDEATSGQELTAEWFPAGGFGAHAPATAGSVEIVDVADGSVEVRYELETADGEAFAGTATLSICHADTYCG